MPNAKIAVIGGTGLYDIEGLVDIEEVDINTPFGKPSDAITIGRLEGVGIAFLPRHGRGHRISPTELPSRANTYAHIPPVLASDLSSYVHGASIPVDGGFLSA